MGTHCDKIIAMNLMFLSEVSHQASVVFVDKETLVKYYQDAS